MNSSPRQLSLDVSLVDDATFQNFYVSANSTNHQAVTVLSEQLLLSRSESSIFIWGSLSVGRSHLLQAACHAAHTANLNSVYLPLMELQSYPPAELLEGLEYQDLICLDDVNSVLGDDEWERELFHLYNRVKDSGGTLLMAADKSPIEAEIKLPDLQSRLNWGLVFQIVPLSDSEKSAALQLRANERGIEMSNDVAQFIMSHYSRDLSELFKLLDQLDKVSLVEQRRLTVPFVKKVLS
jgi:DnaA family protein